MGALFYGIFFWRPGYDEIVCLCAPDAALPGAGAVAVIAGFIYIHPGRYSGMYIFVWTPAGRSLQQGGLYCKQPLGRIAVK